MKKDKIQSTNMFSHTLSIFNGKGVTKVFLISLAVALLVYSFLYGLWNIPIIGFGIMRMSEVVFSDYIFILFTSFVVALLFALIKYERLQKLKGEFKVFTSGSTTVAGIVSAVCPVCQGITIVALGSTIGNIPLGSLIPYLGIIKLASVGLLSLALFLKMDGVYRKACIGCEVIPKKVLTKKIKKEPLLFRNNIALAGVFVIIVLLLVNTILIPKAFVSYSLEGTGTVSLGEFQYGSKLTLKPMPLAAGEQPAIPGYRAKVKSLPTISELPISPPSGDPAQDLLNNIIPRGTPWYGEQVGVSFDDPIAAQNAWGKGNAIQLTQEEETRWGRIVNSFTCDYCCGSPQNPTIITRCGCAHATAAKGMAKWFIKYYGDSYSDEEIYGEMARWYALWYPGPTIKRILQEAQN